MQQKFTNIKINDKHYSAADLIGFAKEKVQSKTTASWEISLYRFVLDWISDSQTIKVSTSGSTGEPKTILLEKENLDVAIENMKLFLSKYPETEYTAEIQNLYDELSL